MTPKIDAIRKLSENAGASALILAIISLVAIVRLVAADINHALGRPAMARPRLASNAVKDRSARWLVGQSKNYPATLS
jgi:hypothetical protein